MVVHSIVTAHPSQESTLCIRSRCHATRPDSYQSIHRPSSLLRDVQNMSCPSLHSLTPLTRPHLVGGGRRASERHPRTSLRKWIGRCEMRRINRRRVGPPGEGVARATAQCVGRRGMAARSTARTRPHRIMRSGADAAPSSFITDLPHRFDHSQHQGARSAPPVLDAQASGCLWSMRSRRHCVGHLVHSGATSRTLFSLSEGR
jgi:hypothetical protein